MPSERTMEKVNATQPLVDELTANLDSDLAREVRSEIRTAAQTLAQGLKCSKALTGLCGRCGWIAEQTGMTEGVCDWIEGQEQQPAAGPVKSRRANFVSDEALDKLIRANRNAAGLFDVY